MNFETLLFDIQDGIATLTLNRPKQMNSLNAKLKEELPQSFRTLSSPIRLSGLSSSPVRAGLFAPARTSRNVRASAFRLRSFIFVRRRHRSFFAASRNAKSQRLPRSTVWHSEVAPNWHLPAIFASMADGAQFGLPEARLGMIPLGGGTQRLPRLVGAARAKELIFTAATLDATTALDIGLVNRVVPADGLREAAARLAEKIASMPPLAIKFAKRAINAGLQTDIDSAMEFELFAGSILNDSEDRNEGMRAFVEKRTAVFKGR